MRKKRGNRILANGRPPPHPSMRYVVVMLLISVLRLDIRITLVDFRNAINQPASQTVIQPLSQPVSEWASQYRTACIIFWSLLLYLIHEPWLSERLVRRFVSVQLALVGTLFTVAKILHLSPTCNRSVEWQRCGRFLFYFFNVSRGQGSTKWTEKVNYRPLQRAPFEQFHNRSETAAIARGSSPCRPSARTAYHCSLTAHQYNINNDCALHSKHRLAKNYKRNPIL